MFLYENLSIFKVDKFCLNFYAEICCLKIDCNEGNSDLCYTSSFRRKTCVFALEK
jgi:hypothetical protein